MPSLHDKAHDSVLCTLSTRTSATAAGFAISSQPSNSRPWQAVRSVHHNTNLTRLGHTPSASQGASVLGHLSIAFGLIGTAIYNLGCMLRQRIHFSKVSESFICFKKTLWRSGIELIRNLLSAPLNKLNKKGNTSQWKKSPCRRACRWWFWTHFWSLWQRGRR